MNTSVASLIVSEARAEYFALLDPLTWVTFRIADIASIRVDCFWRDDIDVCETFFYSAEDTLRDVSTIQGLSEFLPDLHAAIERRRRATQEAHDYADGSLDIAFDIPKQEVRCVATILVEPDDDEDDDSAIEHVTDRTYSFDEFFGDHFG